MRDIFNYRVLAPLLWRRVGMDYLVKPIEFDRFLKAVNKARDWQQGKDKPALSTTAATQTDNEYVLLKSGPVMHKVKTSEILYIEKEENYLAFHTADKKILVRANMTDVFDYVPAAIFCRIHKSFVVSLQHIHAVEVHQVSVEKHKIPIGAMYRDELMKRL